MRGCFIGALTTWPLPRSSSQVRCTPQKAPPARLEMAIPARPGDRRNQSRPHSAHFCIVQVGLEAEAARLPPELFERARPAKSSLRAIPRPAK